VAHCRCFAGGTALLTALIKRVERFELGKTERVINNVMRGFSKVEVTVH
jgi:hypothetical protein